MSSSTYLCSLFENDGVVLRVLLQSVASVPADVFSVRSRSAHCNQRRLTSGWPYGNSKHLLQLPIELNSKLTFER